MKIVALWTRAGCSLKNELTGQQASCVYFPSVCHPESSRALCGCVRDLLFLAFLIDTLTIRNARKLLKTRHRVRL